jgi:hypothetical protein
MESEEMALDVRLNDLLAKLIEFHQQHSGDSSTITQYEYMKADFISKMNQTLKAY